jgi:hypothetical protein
VTSATHSLPGGVNTISAHYAGDATFAPSDSATTQVTVNPEPSTTALSVLTNDANGLPIPFTGGPYGGFVYLRADTASHSGFGTPTGQVTFTDTTSFALTASLNSQGNTATPNGVFTLVPGPHAMTASYLGDPSFQPSVSPAFSFTITKAATTATVQATPTTVATSSFGNAPTGTVLFFNGGTQLSGGTASLISGSATRRPGQRDRSVHR